MRTIRIGEDLPDEIAALAAEARAEGHGNVDRLIAEWAEGACFTGDGEALFAVFFEGELAGVGGVTREPSAPAGRVMRARRFYVARRFRRQGVARALADAIVQQGFEVADRITCTLRHQASGRRPGSALSRALASRTHRPARLQYGLSLPNYTAYSNWKGRFHGPRRRT